MSFLPTKTQSTLKTNGTPSPLSLPCLQYLSNTSLSLHRWSSADLENVAVVSPPPPRSLSPPWLDPSSPPSRRSSSHWSAEPYCSHPPLIFAPAAAAAAAPQPAQVHPPGVTAPNSPYQPEVPKPQRSCRRLDRQPRGVWRPAGFRDELFFGKDSNLIRLRFSNGNLLKLMQLLMLL